MEDRDYYSEYEGESYENGCFDDQSDILPEDVCSLDGNFTSYDSEKSYDIEDSCFMQRYPEYGEHTGGERLYDSHKTCHLDENLIDATRTGDSYSHANLSPYEHYHSYCDSARPTQYGYYRHIDGISVEDLQYYKPSPAYNTEQGMHAERSYLQVPTFKGSFDVDEYLHWIMKVEDIFDDFPCSEATKCKLVSNSFAGLAKLWWETTQFQRTEQGKGKVNSWTVMLQLLDNMFYSESYQQDMRRLLHKCVQGERTVDEYAEEFQVLAFRSSTREDSQECIELFLNGLKTDIMKTIRGEHPADFCDAVLLALKEEKRTAKRKTLSTSQRSFSTETPLFKTASRTETDFVDNLATDQSCETKQSVEFSSAQSDGPAQQHIQIGSLFIGLPMEPTQTCCHQTSATSNNAPGLRAIPTELRTLAGPQITTDSIGLTTYIQPLQHITPLSDFQLWSNPLFEYPTSASELQSERQDCSPDLCEPSQQIIVRDNPLFAFLQVASNSTRLQQPPHLSCEHKDDKVVNATSKEMTTFYTLQPTAATLDYMSMLKLDFYQTTLSNMTLGKPTYSMKCLHQLSHSPTIFNTTTVQNSAVGQQTFFVQQVSSNTGLEKTVNLITSMLQSFYTVEKFGAHKREEIPPTILKDDGYHFYHFNGD